MTKIYLVHHSHTDIGYTHEQPVVVDLHMQTIDHAIEVCEQTTDYPQGSQLKWTCETTFPLLKWLQSRPAKQIERLRKLEQAGRIEITGLFAVMSQCLPAEGLYRQMEIVQQLRRDYGFTITTAMQSDINGQHWGLVEALLDSGIDAFSMAINEHFGRAALKRPNFFKWQGPTGRSILTWNGLHYNANHYFEVPYNVAAAAEKLPEFYAWLKTRDYSHEFFMFQVTRRDFPDNGSINPLLTEFVRQWNQEGRSPRMEIVTLRQFMDVLRGLECPTVHGEWTDFWNFGAASTAYEVALNRGTYRQLFQAELLQGLVGSGRDLANAWENAMLFDEHTWGADSSVVDPYDAHSISELHFKKNYAYQARAQARMARLEAMGTLAREIKAPNPGPHVLAFNPLPWERSCSVTIPMEWLTRDASETPSHVQKLEQEAVYATHPGVSGHSGIPENLASHPTLTTRPIELPAAGYRLLSREELTSLAIVPGKEKPSLDAAENKWFAIKLDMQRGGIASLHDKQRNVEWVDQEAKYRLGQYIYERCTSPEGRNNLYSKPDWSRFGGYGIWNANWQAERSGVRCVKAQRSQRQGDGILLEQEWEAEGIDGGRLEVFLPDHEPWVDLTVRITKQWQTAPEGCYVAFPFKLSGATARYETAGGVAKIHEDQLQGANRDFPSVQNWVDVSTAERGMTVAVLDAPLAMFGGFNFGKMTDAAVRQNGHVISWLMNNYWDTNYAGAQQGYATFRYRLWPHGAFDAAASTRFALEAVYPTTAVPVMNPGGDRPTTGSLVKLSKGYVVPLAMHRSRMGEGWFVRLWNSANHAQQINVESELFSIRNAWVGNGAGEGFSPVEVNNGVVGLTLGPSEVRTVRMQ